METDLDFTSVLMLEDEFFAEGRRDGERLGALAGYHDGKTLGLEHGFERGLELGLYRGCLRAWTELARSGALQLPARALSKFEHLLELIASYPFEDPQNEGQHELLDNIRTKFKVALGQTGLTKQFPVKFQGSGDEFAWARTGAISAEPSEEQPSSSSSSSSSSQSSASEEPELPEVRRPRRQARRPVPQQQPPSENDW